VQTRSCSCGCENQDCDGVSITARDCEVTPTTPPVLNLSVSTGTPTVGETLEITVTDQDGNPIVANIQLTLPDGSVVNLGDLAFASYLVNQPGILVVRASKPGYAGGAVDVIVKGVTTGWSLDKALAGVLSFLNNTIVKAALLLAALLFFFILLAKRRKKKKEVKNL
jgi:hypothetical protein